MFFRKSAKNRAVCLDVNNGIIVTGYVDGDVNLFQGTVPQQLKIPWRKKEVRDNVDALLNWRSGLTELVAREAELKRLHHWASSRYALGVLTLTGDGGVGKTRLAFEFAQQLGEQGWEAGQWTDPERPATFQMGERGTLLVIDYPEEQPTAIDKLLDALNRMEEPAIPLRVLFLSRNPRFSQSVCDRVGTLADSPMALAPLQNPEDHGWPLFTAAWRRMRQVKDLPEQRPPIEKAGYRDWQGSHRLHSCPLFILAYALNLIEDPGATSLTGPEVIERLVAIERRHLEGEARSHNLNRQTLVLPKALAAITRGLTAGQIGTLSQRPVFEGLLPGYDVLREFSVWDTSGDGDEILPALQPDILAACLLSQVLDRGDDKPGQWQYEALAIADPPADASSRLGRLIHDATVTLGLRWPVDALTKTVRGDAARCRVLDDGLSRPYLERPLLGLAIAVSDTLANSATEVADQARHLSTLSVRLAESGDRTGGLAASRRAVEIHEQLAADNVAAYGPDLASSLNTLSVDLAESGDRAGGLAAIRRAVEIYEQLAADNVAAYGPDLALSLNNLSIRLAESGDRAGGLAAIRRAVEIREQLAADNVAAYGTDLARSLAVLSMHLHEAGEIEEAKALLARGIVLIEPVVIEGTSDAELLSFMRQQLEELQAQ